MTSTVRIRLIIRPLLQSRHWLATPNSYIAAQLAAYLPVRMPRRRLGAAARSGSSIPPTADRADPDGHQSNVGRFGNRHSVDANIRERVGPRFGAGDHIGIHKKADAIPSCDPSGECNAWIEIGRG